MSDLALVIAVQAAFVIWIWAARAIFGHHHVWSNWSDPFNVTEYHATGSFGDVGRYERRHQARDCATCNKRDERTVP